MNNKKPIYQILIENISFVALSIVAVWAVIDGFTSAVDFVNISICIFITVIAFIITLVVKFVPFFKWKHKTGDVLKVPKIGFIYYLRIWAVPLALWIAFFFKPAPTVVNPEVIDPHEISKEVSIPIFGTNDTSSFNVLIIRFEDYISHGDTYCIGRSIQENLNVIQANAELPLNLNTYYADSIPPPTSKEGAIRIQKFHNADLILYGLAKNLAPNCKGGDVCFRYSIAGSVIKNIDPIIEVDSFRHDLTYEYAIPSEIEKGGFKINSLSLEKWVRALINVKVNDSKSAYSELDALLYDTLNVDKLSRYIAIGKTYMDLNYFDKALNVFTLSIIDYPNNAELYFYRGYANYELDNIKSAIEDYSTSIKIKPTVVSFKNMGYILRLENRYREALIHYEKALEYFPNSSELYLLKGLIQENLLNYKEGANDYKIAIKLGPSNFQGYYRLAIAFDKLNLPDSSLHYLSEVIGIIDQIRSKHKNLENSNEFNNVKLSSLLNNRGAVYWQIKQFQNSINDFKSAISLDPLNPELYASLASNYSEIDEKQKAIEMYSKSIEIDPYYAQYLYFRSSEYRDLDLYNDAIKDIELAINLDPNFDKYYSYKGETLIEMEKYVLAEKFFVRAIEINPNEPYRYNNLGYAQLKLGKVEKAKVNIDLSKKIDSTNNWACRNLGLYYLITGKYKLSIDNLEKAIEMGYDEIEWFENEDLLKKLKKNDYNNLLKKLELKNVNEVSN